MRNGDRGKKMKARMRGAQHNYNSAMRGGNFAQARNYKQDMENIAAKLK